MRLPAAALQPSVDLVEPVGSPERLAIDLDEGGTENAAPDRFVRFSPQAFREVILGDLEDVRIWSVMMPPRLIGMGRKPVSAPSN